MSVVNPNSIWFPVKEVCKRKHVTENMVMKAIYAGQLDAHEINSSTKSFIFVEVNSKYQRFTNTSHYRLDLNDLIRFTNGRAKEKKRSKRNT